MRARSHTTAVTVGHTHTHRYTGLRCRSPGQLNRLRVTETYIVGGRLVTGRRRVADEKHLDGEFSRRRRRLPVTIIYRNNFNTTVAVYIMNYNDKRLPFTLVVYSRRTTRLFVHCLHRLLAVALSWRSYVRVRWNGPVSAGISPALLQARPPNLSSVCTITLLVFIRYLFRYREKHRETLYGTTSLITEGLPDREDASVLFFSTLFHRLRSSGFLTVLDVSNSREEKVPDCMYMDVSGSRRPVWSETRYEPYLTVVSVGDRFRKSGLFENTFTNCYRPGQRARQRSRADRRGRLFTPRGGPHN